MVRILKLAALFIVIIVVLGVGFARIWGVPDVENHPIATDDETITRGKYLAAAGDCVSCHTAKGGAKFAGGRLIETPFGGIYSAKLTPSKLGIAGMSSAEFYQILAYGADDLLHPVYPAMPYTSYHLVVREDADAILSYLMSLAPVDRAVPENTLSFPYNVRPLLFFWNLLFADRGVFIPDAGKDKVWNRGAYLVRGLGHCGACHTPRNLFGAPERDRALAGARIGAFDAPDIRTEALKKRGWNRELLATFFESGAGPKGTAWGEMFLAVKNSLRYLTHDDRIAIATYLLDTSAADPSYGDTVIATQGDAVAAADKTARVVYLNNCSMCHAPRGLSLIHI